MHTITSEQLSTVSGGKTQDQRAKQMIRTVEACDYNAIKNYFGQPIHQERCYNSAIDGYVSRD